MTDVNAGQSGTGETEGGSGLSAPYAALLDAYLDGRLSEADAAMVRRRGAADPVLGRELALQERLDSSIRRAFVVPASPAGLRIAGTEERAGRGRHAGGWRIGGARRWAVAAAAAVAVATGGYWALVESPLEALTHASAQTAYRRVVEEGFTPRWVCGNEREFANYTRGRLGAAWSMPVEPGLTLVGWRYSEDVLGPNADMLLAKQGETKIVVLADRMTNARRLHGGGGLHVYSREVGDVVMYEVSPLDRAVVIPLVQLVK